MSVLFFAFSFTLSFVLGQIGSIVLYQSTWQNGISRQFHKWGALVTFLRRPLPWLFHCPIVLLTIHLNWQDTPRVHLYIFIATGILSLGAVGRLGAVDIGRFFIFDRFLVVILWLGLWFSPIFLYPLLLTCCCLQYSVSGSSLSPGYSNLLGFEFMRSSLCMGLAGLLVQAGLRLLGAEDNIYIDIEDHLLALVLCGQAAGYVQQAVAKCTLGKRWFSWILENRLQCLIVNAYLRGWGARWIQKQWVLMLAKFVAQFRVFLCATVWLIEFSWLFILVDQHLALGILIATFLFHLAVWLLTGFAGYHYMISHILMIILVALNFKLTWYKVEYALVGGACIVFFTIWVLFVRWNLFREFTQNGNANRWGRVADPANHLMAWWDSPYMRLYSYSVKTVSGQWFCFPVTRFSPYDTFLTDIHTHLMILGQDWELDNQLAADRAISRSGVWGLTVSIDDRNRLYQLMDDPHLNLVLNLGIDSNNKRGDVIEYNICNPSGRSQTALALFFQGINHYQSKWWFRIIFLWPHFPGEDMVPDWSPLASRRLPSYRGVEPVIELAIHCVKTFYREDALHLLDEKVYARIIISTFKKEDAT